MVAFFFLVPIELSREALLAYRNRRWDLVREAVRISSITSRWRTNSDEPPMPSPVADGEA